VGKKQKLPPLSDHEIEKLRDAARGRVPIDDLHAGVAVMFLDPKIIERMCNEIIRRRKRD
jgi:hypothetical protein